MFTPEQVLGAMLTKLKTTVEAQCKDIKKVSDCVVAVPTHFTDVQRRAVECAIKVAGLNGLRTMNESTAIALTYGMEFLSSDFKKLNCICAKNDSRYCK